MAGVSDVTYVETFQAINETIRNPAFGIVFFGSAGNVPLNDELAAIDISSPGAAAEIRADFEDDWNQLNLLRSFAIGASFVTLVTANLLTSSHQSPLSTTADRAAA